MKMSIKDIIKHAEQSGGWLAYRRAAQKIKAALAGGEVVADFKVKAAFLSSFTMEPIGDYALLVTDSFNRKFSIPTVAYMHLNRKLLSCLWNGRA